jgi:microcystin-dependent protein
MDANARVSLGDCIAPSGFVAMWGSATPPAGWLLCDGTPQSRTLNQALFAAIGEAYGKGDGTTSFNLPDMRARIPVGYKQGDVVNGNLGGTGGANRVTLDAANMPIHTHTGTSTDVQHGHSGTTGLPNQTTDHAHNAKFSAN